MFNGSPPRGSGERGLSLPSAFLTKEILRLVASVVDDHLFEDNARSQGMQVEHMGSTSLDRESYCILHHATGNGGIKHTIDVLRSLVELTIKVHSFGLAVVYAYLIFMSTTIQEIEC